MPISDDLYNKIMIARSTNISIRQTARDLGLNRKTVSNYYSGKKIPGIKGPSIHETGLIREDDLNKLKLKEKILEDCRIIEENYKSDIKNKPKITRLYMYNEISTKYNLSYQTFCRMIRNSDFFVSDKSKSTYIPLEFRPGEVMQVDFCEVTVNLEGVSNDFKADLFCSVLSNSYDIFAMIFPNQKRENFFEGHLCAFEYYGGRPEKIFYDNAAVNVKSGTGKHAIETDEFIKFKHYYSFESIYMNGSSGNEKGHVENLCKLVRHLAFVPKPRGKSLKEIQQLVMSRIIHYRETHHVKSRVAPILEMSTAERLELRKLPVNPYPVYPVLDIKIGKFLTFKFETCEYSVPSFIKRDTEILIRVFPYEIDC
jgi:transposase